MTHDASRPAPPFSLETETIAKDSRSWRPGRNCWTAADVEDSGLLIDGRAYYLAFYEAAQRAQRSILIAGWKFNSDVRLVRGADAAPRGGDVKFLSFLGRLCRQNPLLHIYVLAWDFAIIYAHEWEGEQKQKFEQAAPGQIHFCADDQHAVGGSHHQKFVVIDGKLALIGGLDFNADDWDDRRHEAENPERADSGKPPHEPYHDIQAYAAGPAAREAEVYFQARWQEATGTPLNLAEAPSDPPLRIEPSVRLTAARLALSRNEPRTVNDPRRVLEIRRLYLDAIAAAQSLIYIENQYFSSQTVFQALLDRLQAPHRTRLELVLLLPKRFPAWIESVAMGPPRLRMLDELRAAAQATGHRLGVYYPVSKADDGREVPILLHSKLLVVDDRFLTVGSCNTSNRSMGLDTELNVSWEATGRGSDQGGSDQVGSDRGGTDADGELRASIRRARIDLLAELTGLEGADAARELGLPAGLVTRLDAIAADPSSKLRRLTPEGIVADQEWLQTLAKLGFWYDPGKPLEDTVYEQLTPAPDSWLRRGLGWVRTLVGGRRTAS